MKLFEATIVAFLLAGFFVSSIEPSRADSPAESVSVGPTVNTKEQTNKMIELVRSGDFNRAESLMAGHIEQKTRSEGGFLAASTILSKVFELESKNFSELTNVVAPRFDEWLRAKPKSSTAHVFRGVYHFTTAWKHRGTSFANKVDNSSWELFRRELQLAEAMLRQAIELDKNNFLSYAPLIDVLRSLSASDESIEAIYQQANSVVRYSPHVVLARSLSVDPRWGGSWSEQSRVIREAISNAPTEDALLYAAADSIRDRCCLEHGKDKASCLSVPATWSEIETPLLKLISGYPKTAFYAQQLAKAANQAEKWNIAGKYYLLAAEREQDNRDARYMAGYYYVRKSGMPDGPTLAIPHLEAANTLEPGNANTLSLLGVAYRKVGNLSAAVTALTEAIKLEPGDFQNLVERAYCYSATRQLDKARADCEAALGIKPSDSYAQKLCLGIESQSGR